MGEFLLYIGSINPYSYISILMVVFSVYYAMLKDYVLNIFDPLFQLIVFSSFGVALVIQMFVDDKISFYELIFFILSNFIFWLGYIITLHKRKKHQRKQYSILIKKMSSNVYLDVATILWIVLIISSLFLYITRGIPLFSENPSDAKVLFYGGGAGIIRYIHMIFPTLIGSVFFIQLWKKKDKKLIKMPLNYWFIIFMFISTIFVAVSVGSKTSMLFLMGILSIFLAILKQKNDLKEYKEVLRLSYRFILCAVIYMFVVILTTPYTANNPLVAFMERMVAEGDGYFFYYGYDLSKMEVYKEKTFFDFIVYCVLPIKSILGITEHDYPLGAYIMYYATNFPLSSFGPNAKLPMVADIYFKKEFSLPFMFMMGTLLGFVREVSIDILLKIKYIGMPIYLFLWNISLSLFTDINFFISQCFVFVVLIIPILIFGYLLVKLYPKTNKISSV